MDDQRVGRIVRALRRRRGWRQLDLARAAACSQRTVSRAELGRLPAVPTIHRMLAALDAWLSLEVHWRAGALDRLMDEAHAGVVGQVARLLQRAGWLVKLEVTYSEFGERGSADVLAFSQPQGILLVVEVKTDLTSIEATLRKLDEKARLLPKVARERFGWDIRTVARVLAMPETSTLRRRVARHSAVLESAFQVRGGAFRAWVMRPVGTVAGLWLLSPSQGKTAIRGNGGPERMRTSKRPPPRHRVAA